MKHHYFKVYGIALALSSISGSVMAQATSGITDPNTDFKLARDLYQKGQVSLAYPLFKTLYFNKSENQQRQSVIPLAVQTESQYYTIVCGLILDDPTAEKDAISFEVGNFDEVRTQMVSYFLAEYYFRKKDYQNAATYYEKAGYDNLTNEQLSSVKFHQGYAYFMLKNFAKAKPLFNAIRQIPTDPNYNAANYYYGFIALDDKNYNEALKSFQIVEKDPKYAAIVPYYIMEIYYFQGDTDKAISYGQIVLNKGGQQFYAKDMQLLLGHAFFDRKDYNKALPYLEQYVSSTADASREDIYQLSYCYYQAKKYNEAILGFKQLGGTQDSLSQNSMYLLADSYLETNQKANARNAFLFCSQNSSDLQEKEISQFNYAKLSYELGYQDIALNELKKFIATYPNSNYKNESNELLVSLLASTNNFKDAMSLLDKTGTNSDIVKRVYPRILYGRAVELVNDQRTFDAETMFNNVLKSPYNTQEIQPTYFWKGEIDVRSGKYDEAVTDLNKYLANPVTLGEVNIENAQYNLGYAYLRNEQYAKALAEFQKVAPKINESSSTVQKDAYVRQADCYFMQKQFSKASQMYHTVVDNNFPSADYAYYQLAVIAGAQGRSAEKVKYLQSFDKKYGKSSLAGEANMEMAYALMAQENFEQAITPLNAVIANPAATSLRPKAYLNVGVCQYNLSNNDAAITTFQKLISTYPNAQESSDALDYVKSIYMGKGQPDAYIAFMHKNGKDLSNNEADSLNYSTALAALGEQQWDKASSALQNYIRQYPNGYRSIDAHYQLATIQNRNKDYSNALSNFDYVAQKAPNKYAEASVLEAGRIAYFQNKDYNKAEKYYTQLKSIASNADNRLESMRGLIRCQYKLEQWSDALTNAKDLLNQSGIATDDKQMANIVIAKNAQLNGDESGAIDAYKKVYASGKSEYAAEARYRVAEIYLSEEKLKDAEKSAFEVINKAGSYDYWITKSYILLGEVYYREKDYFNAEATLKSVIDNASDETLKSEAQKKLNAVNAASKNAKK
ncbi:tetratricopeptide repeat protein [Rhizosphaericola mali]|uniref:Tetratricopeptide repeat protein n=1 Tax=Rhizosphaericola mali TaxID=2545455 RepID=A0A5P2G3T1_9BACT|nr:tetratricopeptide repeat protein [Rhizosphaericola mali]QES89867.1 tetratricopeptide repeat protein [Rhizosphaericola mali]